MNRGKWLVGAFASLGAVLLMSGCSGFWNAAATSTAPTTTTLSSGYFFVLDTVNSQIISYNIASGALMQVSTTTGVNVLPATPLAFTVAPNGQFLYVSTTNGVYLYTVASGVLTLATGTMTSDIAVAMQVDVNNDWLLETSGTGTLYAIPIVTATGAIDPSRKTATIAVAGTTVNGMAIAPNDDYVYLALGTNGTAAYGFTYTGANPFSATVTNVKVINATAGAALSVAVDPSSRLLYVGEAAAVSGSGGGLRAFTIGAGGTLTEVTGSPLNSGGTGPRAILPKSTGDYVYVANWNGITAGNITGFSLTDTNSVFSLTKLSTSVATGDEPLGMVEDSNANFVICVSALGNPDLNAYYFDTTTVGQLDLTITSSSFAGTAIAAGH